MTGVLLALAGIAIGVGYLLTVGLAKLAVTALAERFDLGGDDHDHWVAAAVWPVALPLLALIPPLCFACAWCAALPVELAESVGEWRDRRARAGLPVARVRRG